MSELLCGASRALPVDESTSWDGGAAEASIFSWAGWPDDPDPSKARQGFLASVDGSTQQGDYKLPFANVQDGKLTAVRGGINAAASRLPQMDDLADGVKADLQSVIDHYVRLQGSRQNAADATSGVLPFNAVSIRTQAPDDALVGMARAAAMDPSVFNDHPPFFGRATISTNRVDGYFTRMLPSSLQNYASDAAEGRSVLTGHNHQTLGVGYSLTGSFVGGPNARVESDFYTIQGLPDTDDAITRIRAGLVRDTSIGFYGGDIRCSICGRSWMDWDCSHIPGLQYQADPTNPNSPRGTAIGNVDGAHLAEYSLVYDGATPGCGLLKAYREVDAGRVNPDQARSIENRYRVRLPQNPTSHRFSGWSTTAAGIAVPTDDTPESTEPTPIPNREQETAMADDATRHSGMTTDPHAGSMPHPTDPSKQPDGEDIAEYEDPAQDEGSTGGDPEDADTAVKGKKGPARSQDDQLAAIRAALAATGQPEDTEPVQAIRALGRELSRLRPLADDGRRYRSDLVSEALREGVRAFGNGFAQERYRTLLERDATTLDEIKGFRDDWQALANNTIPAGRSIRDTEEAPPTAARQASASPVAPDAAFAA